MTPETHDGRRKKESREKIKTRTFLNPNHFSEYKLTALLGVI